MYNKTRIITIKLKCSQYATFNPFTTEARFYVLNAIAFSTYKQASVVKGLSFTRVDQYCISKQHGMTGIEHVPRGISQQTQDVESMLF